MPQRAPAVTCRARGCKASPDADGLNGRCSDHRWCASCLMCEVETATECPTCRQYRKRTGKPRTDRYPRLAERQAELNEDYMRRPHRR